MPLLSTAGCQLGNPLPSILVLWKKPRADRGVIEQSLLKCGWKPVYASSSDINCRIQRGFILHNLRKVTRS